ncbi:DUF924 family protein [Microvirga mediterraneensis]|uniref:DUF924 domain-containing protein n=1 Tax=Microvirga mediterraneensis TaxID=2754695 RepID=A0A838BSY4_9HYPH|nr:DUF924 family protein [Microvirga mediterraneensis]MBA1158132.1 DUF924 domain-containing protein [Microvirga mediterraneensis]
MSSQLDWRRVHDFWFPVDLSRSGIAAHWEMMAWWLHGGVQAELPPFAPLVHAARSGQLDHWRATPPGRLSLIIVLDQFPRSLFAGTPQAYSSDQDALGMAEEGFGNGHYDDLTSPYEKFFYLLPLVHAEGPDHGVRMKRVVAIAERALDEAPAALKPVWLFSLNQARTRFDIISRFGRFPHRNPVLGRPSTPQELTYLAKDDFVHTRSLPTSASSAISAIG